MHCNEVAVNFPRIKEELNMCFKGVHLITGRIIPQWILRHSLADLLNFKDLKSVFFDIRTDKSKLPLKWHLQHCSFP